MDNFINAIRRNELQKVAAICYIISEDRALMIDRIKEPFKGYFAAPGGKREEGEDIESCIKREIFEETGLRINDPELKVVTTETGPENYNWILFIYVCRNFTGQVKESDEGKLVWVNIGDLMNERFSQIHKDILPYLFSDNKYLMHLRYDEEKDCIIESIEELMREQG
jgi:8-oxo-dGTP diphosphatase